MVGGGGMSKVNWNDAPKGAEFYAHKFFRRQGAGADYPWIFSDGWKKGMRSYDQCLNAADYESRPTVQQWPDDEPRPVPVTQQGDAHTDFKTLTVRLEQPFDSTDYIIVIEDYTQPVMVINKAKTHFDIAVATCGVSFKWKAVGKSAPPAPQWPDDEDRIDTIATNGNTGEHYAPTHPVTAVEFLNACVAVQSERGQQYDPNGTGERSFAAAAIAFTALTGKPLVGSDICLIIELVKKVRQYSKPDRIHHDSLLDSVSYDSLWAAELIKELSK